MLEDMTFFCSLYSDEQNLNFSFSRLFIFLPYTLWIFTMLFVLFTQTVTRTLLSVIAIISAVFSKKKHVHAGEQKNPGNLSAELQAISECFHLQDSSAGWIIWQGRGLISYHRTKGFSPPHLISAPSKCWCGRLWAGSVCVNCNFQEIMRCSLWFRNSSGIVLGEIGPFAGPF